VKRKDSSLNDWQQHFDGIQCVLKKLAGSVHHLGNHESNWCIQEVALNEISGGPNTFAVNTIR
jgi:hypothetical protein